VTHKIDLVIADAPISPGIRVRGFNHPLGDCGTTFFATPKLARKLGKKFPENLKGAPLLLPGKTAALRSHLAQWFDEQGIHPCVIGEFDDSALMKAFGQTGAGVFIAPSVISDEVKKQYGVVAIGEANEVRAKFYAISVERKLSHPAVVAITTTARDRAFRDKL